MPLAGRCDTTQKYITKTRMQRFWKAYHLVFGNATLGSEIYPKSHHFSQKYTQKRNIKVRNTPKIVSLNSDIHQKLHQLVRNTPKNASLLSELHRETQQSKMHQKSHLMSEIKK